MKKIVLSLVLSGFLGMTTALGTELLPVPSARVEPAGFMEFGGIFDYNKYPESDNLDAGHLFKSSFMLRASLTDNFEYQLLVDEDQTTLHSINLNLLKKSNPNKTRTHYFSIGVKNLGWEENIEDSVVPVEINLPVLDVFSMYTLSLDDGNSEYSIGTSSDRDTLNTLFIARMEKQFFFGRVFTIWDGVGAHFGIRSSRNGKNIYFMYSVDQTESEADEQTRLFSIGLSYSTNLLDNLVSDMVHKDDMEMTVRELNERIYDLERAQKTSNLIQSSHFLDEVDKHLTDKLAEKQTSTDKAMERGFIHMQKGLDYYYAGKFDVALEHYKTVVALMPDSKYGQERLGSIYFQLNQYENAKSAWEAALALDPEDTDLLGFIQQANDKLAEQKDAR